jgi:hypothetical protein
MLSKRRRTAGMKKHKKEKLRRIRSLAKASKLVRKLYAMVPEHEDVMRESGPLYYWYALLSKLKNSDIRFLESYEAREGHLFNVIIFREALATVSFERNLNLKKE